MPLDKSPNQLEVLWDFQKNTSKKRLLVIENRPGKAVWAAGVGNGPDGPKFDMQRRKTYDTCAAS